MNRNLLTIILLLSFISCKNKNTSTSVEDNSKRSSITKYFYTYEAGKLALKTEKTYSILSSQLIDSTTTQTQYIYNDKDLLIEEIIHTDFEDIPTIKRFNYDDKDSIVSELSISPEKDTTFWEEYTYYPDGRKTTFQRSLQLHLDPTQDLAETFERKRLDTIQVRNEFKYTDNQCVKQNQFNSAGTLIKTINFEYNHDQLFKETHTSYVNGLAIIEKIKYYDYTKSIKHPEWHAVVSTNDTIELCINEFEDNQLMVSTEFYEHGYYMLQTYYDNGLEVGIVSFDRMMNYKTTNYISYYENGQIKEIKNTVEE